jgi:hypothetical protein
VLEGLNLTDAFHDVASDRRRQHFKALNDAIGVDDEPAAGFHAGILKVNAKDVSDLAAAVGKHGEGDAAFDHFGKFMVIPHFVDKDAVHTHG